MAVKITNNAVSTLATSIIAGANSLSLAAGDGAKFPALSPGDWFPLTLVNSSAQREIVKVTERVGDVLTVTRAQEGTAALPFAAGDKAELRLTAAVFTELTALITQAQSDASAADKTDVGMIVMKANTAVPARGTWLKCDGSLVSRTTYATLFAAIGTTFGAGNGSTTFALPDFRGVVPRGLDEGKGYDTGRTLGSYQADQNKGHAHTASAASDTHSHSFSDTTSSGGSHSHTETMYNSGALNGASSNPASGVVNGASYTMTTSTAGAHTHTVSGTTGSDSHTHTITVASEGGTEARMKNIAVPFWIRAA